MIFFKQHVLEKLKYMIIFKNKIASYKGNA